MTTRKITGEQICKINAFARGPFLGNPAGVCLLTGEPDTAFCRETAAGIGFPETAFVYREGSGYRLRWFTPNGTEVDLCGHATLAAAYVLFNQGYEETNSKIKFFTRSGPLTVSTDGESICLDFPAEDIYGLDGDAFGIDAALGARSTYTSRTSLNRDAFIELPSETNVKNLKPDLSKLKCLPGRGVIVTARSDNPEYDFVSRFFAPKLGIDEDPVTGSAHCALAVYWGCILNKDSLTGYQASARGGIIGVTLSNDRVILRGTAVEIPESEK